MYHVEITGKQSYSFTVKAGDSEFSVDAKGKGFTPPDTLLASLGSCIGVYIRKYFEGAKIDLGEFKVIVEAELTKEPPVALREIKVSVDLRGANLEERRKKPLLDFLKNCPVSTTLKINPRVDINLV